ncbi:MAG: hypothetical protein V2J26_12965 [Pacificimonas sp.]|jgi:hypothetical protein|nr:hypothetical protein [Pacificimonas sp.]
MFRLAFAVLVIATGFAASVSAQSRIDRYEEARIPTARGLSDEERSRLATYDYAKCVWKAKEWRVDEALATYWHPEKDEKTIMRLVESRCLSSGELTMSQGLFRGAFYLLAAHKRMADDDFDFAPYAVPDWQALMDSAEHANPASLPLLLFGSCVLRQGTSAVRDFVNSEVASSEEKAAIGEIAPSLSGCIPAGAEVKFSRSALKALLAENLYRETLMARAGALPAAVPGN